MLGPPTHAVHPLLEMTDIRTFFTNNNTVTLVASSDEDEGAFSLPPPQTKRSASFYDEGGSRAKISKPVRTQQTQQEVRQDPNPKDQTAPLNKLLVVKSEGQTPGVLCKPDYQNHAKHVIATHRSIRVRAGDTVTCTVKQRGQIDAEIGDQEESLGYDELLALVDAAQMIAELITAGDGNSLVVIAYRKKGAHGAYLLGKLAWNVIARQDKKLGDATKVGEPGKWLYSKLWKELKSKKPEKVSEALDVWYKSH